MTFEPEPFRIVSDPRQIKAYTDPLRIRILHILSDREATNHQLAAALGESQAKVLHHVRFLLDAGLIRLVEERVRGGNVEKYYRATARLYGLRPAPAESPALSGAVFESITQELVASATLWPDRLPSWEGRRARLSPERVEKFNARLMALIEEYWGGPDTPPEDDPDGQLMAFAAVTYRFPGDE
jgi:DNA-binding transcriptional ArsR family regulator